MRTVPMFLSLLLALAEPAAAMEQTSEWANVTALGTGSDLRVDLVSGERATGRLASTTHNEVTLSVGHTERILSRETIRRVVLLGRRMTVRHAGRGFVVGAVFGGLLGMLTAKTNRAPWTAMMAAGWGALGTVIGAYEGSSRVDETVVYELHSAEG